MKFVSWSVLKFTRHGVVRSPTVRYRTVVDKRLAFGPFFIVSKWPPSELRISNSDVVDKRSNCMVQASPMDDFELRTPRHRYNTRSSARNSSRCHNQIVPARMDLDLEMAPYRGRFCTGCIKIIILFIILAMTASFVNVYTETYSTLTTIIRDLDHLQTQVEQMKDYLQIANDNKDSTAQKLEVIEKILTNIKTTQTRVPETCKSTPPPKVPSICPKATKQKDDSIRKLIKEELEKYDADKTGKVDFALESAGGNIISTRNTETYQGGSSSISLFGMRLCQITNSARAIIQAGVLPGECWAFQGSTGSAVIRLLGRVQITGVSLEHISRSVSPSGDIDTAPREFSIWGLSCEKDTEGQFLGTFIYDINGLPLQHFTIDNVDKAYAFIEFKVHSNNGHSEYTCVYRLRVHGTLDNKKGR